MYINSSRLMFNTSFFPPFWYLAVAALLWPTGSRRRRPPAKKKNTSFSLFHTMIVKVKRQTDGQIPESLVC